MCRSLRSVFLQILWERIEVVPIFIGSLGKASRKSLARELLRQLEVVTIRNPALAAYVNIVNVVITDYSCEGVIEEFARCLALFKNLKTIQILRASEKQAPDAMRFWRTFANLRFPSVRTLAVPRYASDILQCCPGARFVFCSFPMHISDVKKWCPDIQKLTTCYHYRGFTIWRVTEDIKEVHPFSRSILPKVSAPVYVTYELNLHLNSFRSRSSCFTIHVSCDKDSITPAEVARLVRRARELLQRQVSDDEQPAKTVQLKYRDGKGEFSLRETPPQ
ncbi:hypothetical protein LshimejAT787_0310130 [Lyophyllum shimeji]|uniref:Uncharacterized protein n=1 Tax=Lyophyllum shimeji TaxID=47721 RepID=A0A9P3PJ54_LYOSH|nr:hypothetical protein LshimejAT787_0310130 [Lyophyllum shimeji]